MTTTIDPVAQDAIDKIVRFAGERHVKTEKGVQEYKEPIGAPIVAHPYQKVTHAAGKAESAAAGLKPGEQATGPSKSPNSGSIPLNLGGATWHVPAGSKIYSFPSTIGGLETDRLLRTPDGKYFYLGAEGHAPLASVTAAQVADWLKEKTISELGTPDSTPGETAYQGIKLQPGDTVHSQGDGSVSHVGVVHSDGSATVHTKTSDGKYVKDFDTSSHGFAKNPKLAQHPEPAPLTSEEEVAAKANSDATGAPPSTSATTATAAPKPAPEKLGNAGVVHSEPAVKPVVEHPNTHKGIKLQPGDKVHAPHGPVATAEGGEAKNPFIVIHKNGKATQYSEHDGKYVADFNGEPYDKNHGFEQGEKLAEHVAEKPKKATTKPAPKAGQPIESTKQLDDMPIGAVAVFHSGTTTEYYTKLDDGTWSDGSASPVHADDFTMAIKAGEVTVKSVPGGDGEELKKISEQLSHSPATANGYPATAVDMVNQLAPGSKFTTKNGDVLTKAADGFWEGPLLSSGISNQALYALYGGVSGGQITHIAPEPGTESDVPTVKGGTHVEFGGVAVDAADLHSALAILSGSKGMMIKGPLEKESHPLATTDYHAIVEAYKKTHPEFQPQTKFAAKEAFLEALKAQIESIDSGKSDDAAVGHAQSDGTTEFGGVKATPDQLHDAYNVLSEAPGMMIKGPLEKAGNPLATSDYHGVVAQHKAATSFKAQGKYAAKEAFVAALKAKLDDINYWTSQVPGTLADTEAKTQLSNDLKPHTYTWAGKTFSVNIPSGSDIYYGHGEQTPEVYAAVKDGKVTHAWAGWAAGHPEVIDDPNTLATWQFEFNSGSMQLVNGHSPTEPHKLNPGIYKKPGLLAGSTHLVINPNGSGYLADQFGALNPDAPFHDASWVANQVESTYTKYQAGSDKTVGIAAPLPIDEYIATVTKTPSSALPPGPYYDFSGHHKMTINVDGTGSWYPMSDQAPISHGAAKMSTLMKLHAGFLTDGNGNQAAWDGNTENAVFFGVGSNVQHLKQLQMDLHDPNAEFLNNLTKHDVLNGELQGSYGVDVDPTKFTGMPDGIGWQQHAKLALAKMFGQPGGDKDSVDPSAHNVPTPEPQTLAQATATYDMDPGANVGSLAHLDALPNGTEVQVDLGHVKNTYDKSDKGWSYVSPDGTPSGSSAWSAGAFSSHVANGKVKITSIPDDTPQQPQENATGLTQFMGIQLSPGQSIYHSQQKKWIAVTDGDETTGVVNVYYPQPDGTAKIWKTFPAGGFTQLKPEFLIGTHNGPVAATDKVINTPAPVHAVIEPSAVNYQSEPPYKTAPEIAVLSNFIGGYATKTKLNDKAKELAAASGYKNVAAQYLSKMSAHEVRQWIQAWLSNDLGKAYDLEKVAAGRNGNADIKTPHKHPGNQPTPKVIFGPSVKGEIPAGVWINDPSGVIHTTNYSSDISEEAADAYLIAAHMQNPQGLTANQKKQWAWNHARKQKLSVDQLSLKAQTNVLNGDLLSEPLTPPVPLSAAGEPLGSPNPDWKFDPAAQRAENLGVGDTAAYLAQLYTGKTLKYALAAPLPAQQTIAQLHWLTTDANDGETTTRAQATATFDALSAHMVAQAAHASDGQDPITAFQQTIPLEGKTYVPVLPGKGDPKLDGAGEKTFVVEKFSTTGTKYLFKIAQYYSQNRPYVEDAAHQAASLFGYSPAQSAPVTVELPDGAKFGQIQTLIPHAGQIEGVAPEDLTDSQLAQVLREHVLDWVLDNDDTHAGNLLVKDDGSIAGIDKGRSWGGDSLRFGQYELKPKALAGSLSHNAHLYYEDVYKAIIDGKIDPKRALKAYQAVMSKARSIEKAPDASYKSILDYAFERRAVDGKPVKSPFGSTVPEVVDAIVARKNNVSEDFDKLWTQIFDKAGIEKPVIKPLLAPGVHLSPTAEFIEATQKGGFTGHSLMVSSLDIQDSHIHTKFVNNPDGTKSLMGLGRLRTQGDDKMMAWIKANADPKLFGANTPPKADTLNPKDGSIDSVSAYAAMLPGIKTINGHAADGKYNEGSIATAQSAADKLQAQVKMYTTNKQAAADAWYEGDLTKAAEHVAMAEQYLAAWKTATAAKQFHEKGPKDFSSYVYVPQPKAVAEAPPSVYKIKKIDSGAPSGAMNYETGEFDANGELFHDNQNGQEYEITLPSGAVLKYRPHGSSYLAQHGQFRFITHTDNNESAFGEVTQFMREAGVDLNDADDTSLELHYWRHLYGIMRARVDRDEGPQMAVTAAALGAGLDNVKANFSDNPLAELAAWREAWSQFKGAELVNKWVDSQGYLPKFERVAVTDSENGHGQPYWMRFDYDPVQWRKDHPHPLATSFNGLHGGNLHGRKAANGDDISLSVVKSGGRQSGSWRINNFGFSSSGTSTASDQDTGGGSYLFTRQSAGAQYHMYMDPALMLRTSTYSFHGDEFGKKALTQSQAYFNPEEALKYNGNSNETMIKSQASVLDTAMVVVFDTDVARNLAIDYYKANGITEIGGIPLDKVFVLESERSSALDAAKKVVFQDYEGDS